VAKITYHLSKLFPFVGKECIYKDSSSIRLAKLVEIRILENELALILEPLKSIGFKNGQSDRFEISCISEYLRIYNGYIHASIVNWTLFVDPVEVKYLVHFAQKTTDIRTLLYELGRFRKPLLPRSR
jgi:hypothetical protein